MHIPSPTLALVMSLALLSACGGSTSRSFQEELTESAVPAPVGAARLDIAALGAAPSGELELVSNGLFDQGSDTWTPSTRRGEWGTSGSIVGDLPQGVTPPFNGRTQLARLCGYPTERITSTEISRGTCNDILSTVIDLPAGARNLTLHVSAFARYDCPADQRGAFVIGLTAQDGLAHPSPRSMQFKEDRLPAGQWQDLTFTVDSVPGLDTQARKIKLTLLFSTGPACKPPADSGTYVLVTDISARVNP